MDLQAKPRLLLIGHTYMLSVNREKAKALSNHYEVLVCTIQPNDWTVLGKQSVDSEDPAHLKHYELKRLERWPHTQKFTFFTLRGLGQQIRSFKPDVILVENEPWSLMRWHTWALTWLYAPNAIFAEFTWENVARTGLKGTIFKLVYSLAAITADRVICGNLGAAQLFRDAGLDEKQIHVDGQLGVVESDYPPCKISEKRTWRSSIGWPEDSQVIGFCGRLVEEKGLCELIEAFHQLRSEFPNLRLALLGQGPMEESIKTSDHQCTLIKVLPAVPHRKVPQFLNKIDIFVLPSKPLNQSGKHWEEQFGHVLIEAMMAGALTIGSNSGAIPEVLRDPEMIFPHSDAGALKSILRHMLANPDIAEQKKIEQRSYCLSHWSHEAVAARYRHFLDGTPKI